MVRRAESRGDCAPLQGDRRAAADARFLGLSRAAPRGRERGRLPLFAEARRASDRRGDPDGDRGGEGSSTRARGCAHRDDGTAMSDWVGPLHSLLVSDGRAVLVTLASVRGSTPRDAGTKMIVTLHATHGTIGGGHLEFDAIRIAREALGGSGVGAWLARFPLAARLGQCCGGVATLLFQCVDRDDAQWLHELQQVEDDVPRALASPIAASAASPFVLTAGTIAK